LGHDNEPLKGPTLRIPEIPGNYPKDYLQYLQKQKAPAFDVIHKFKEVRGVLLALDLRNFTRTMDKQSSELMNVFLSDFFEEISQAIQKVNSGVVNKLLGDGLLAHFQEVEPNRAIELSFEILRIFQMARRKPKLWYLGLTQVISQDNYYLGTIGRTSYLDFTLIGKNINRLFRLLGDGRGDCIYITDQLLEKIVDNYVTMQSGISVLDGIGQPILTHVVFRKKNDYEIQSGVLPCPTDCELYKYCFPSWKAGRDHKGSINCLDCGKREMEVINGIEHDSSRCKIWDKCLIKANLKGEDQKCCHGCENFRNCYHSYLLGKNFEVMVRCTV